MFKALYAFNKTHPTSLSFNAQDVFIGLPGAGADKNWYYVLDTRGFKGFVPRNYVQKVETLPSSEDFNKLLDSIRINVIGSKIPDKERGDTLAKIELLRTEFSPVAKPPPTALDQPDKGSEPASTSGTSTVASAPAERERSPRPQEVASQEAEPSKRDSTPPPAKSTKKKPAPKPPARKEEAQSEEPKASESKKHNDQHVNALVTVTHSSADHIEKAEEVKPQAKEVKPENGPSSAQPRKNSIQHIRKASLARANSLATDMTPDQIRAEARELVEVVREMTGLSHMASQATARTVLHYVHANLNKLDKNVPQLLHALERPVINNAEEVASSPDAKAIESVFQQLAAVRNDSQQRNWALHEDEPIIETALRRLLDLLHSSDVRVSRYVIRRHKYDYVDSLVEYHQMETRRALRLLLMEVFLQICTLDPVTVINRLLISVLPLELAQDVYSFSTTDHERAKLAAMLLTVLFSRGEPLPVQYLEPGQIGRNFVDFVLEIIEKPVQKRQHDLSDVYIGMMVSYNLQFGDLASNVFMDRLGMAGSAKTYTEKILLLLNREDDPAAVIGRDHLYFSEEGEDEDEDFVAQGLPNSVVKIIMDMFRHRNCRDLFYTNDLYVLIDIIVRQLADLSPEDPRRMPYVVLCQLVLKHTNYDDHLHRFKDLQERFMRILEGDESTKEKDIVSDICKEVSAFNSLINEPW